MLYPKLILLQSRGHSQTQAEWKNLSPPTHTLPTDVKQGSTLPYVSSHIKMTRNSSLLINMASKGFQNPEKKKKKLIHAEQG